MATATSFTFVITIDTVDTDEVRPAATTRKVKLSAPVRFKVGVYVSAGAVPLSTPLVGCVSNW